MGSNPTAPTMLRSEPCHERSMPCVALAKQGSELRMASRRGSSPKTLGAIGITYVWRASRCPANSRLLPVASPGSVSAMKQIVAIVGIALAIIAVAWGLHSCSQRMSGRQGLPAGVEYVFRCRADGHEFKLTPEQMTEAFNAGEVRGSGDGMDLFKCPQCGKYEAVQMLKGEETP